jgi:hypothetical protein
MLICIDSCVFIRGINQEQSDAGRLLELIGPEVRVIIHRLIVQEVTRNLVGRAQVRTFYKLFHKSENAFLSDAPIPQTIIERYMALGLREKGDTYIGAFAEWMRVDYLISDNRQFLRELRTDAYRLLAPGDFLTGVGAER